MNRVIQTIALIFLGCCSNVIFLEFIVRPYPGSGNIITFAQFLFIAIEGCINYYQWGGVQRHVPLKNYGILVLMFFLVSVINNYALNFNIPMPLHMIFRSGSLIANLILGMIILKKRYKFREILSVVLITFGIILATYASSQSLNKQKSANNIKIDQTEPDVFRWTIGICMLVFALLVSALMGIYQETIYAKYGKHPQEALFYSHLLPLPLFALVGKDIYQHAQLFNQSTWLPIFSNVGVPIMWAYLFCNVLTQYFCIRSVFILTTECPSLIVTLVITLRKFVSLLFSIIYFQNEFTFNHWIGTASVFLGTFLFSNIHNEIIRFFRRPINDHVD
ncbi:unnamed protein product [Adineta steineri]|uniref:UDP-xylose and UDP-N-acetylglucosamine transporter-like protein n=1 Tax=Adineta steineri TaxID=433720 RepID=A0A814F425_9BILA|nr:unnamed protein product [Adineta steineri]CAF1284376.1 unnamed protein product [Adineta steineri]CAF1469864.1 unnamed protein product [Adineta steineri]CAF1558334.1 unnamed protein product [Adineta steineri]